jgi:predicted transcriptional regulator
LSVVDGAPGLVTTMTFRLRAGKKGLELRLHELEASIMDVVWSKRLTSFAVSDVLIILEKRRSIAYTTVMTTVSRLHAKGLLERVRDGKRYLYSPKLSREKFLEATAREVLDGAVGGHQAIAMLAEKVSEASAVELDQLEALIRRRRGELGGE